MDAEIIRNEYKDEAFSATNYLLNLFDGPRHFELEHRVIFGDYSTAVHMPDIEFFTFEKYYKYAYGGVEMDEYYDPNFEITDLVEDIGYSDRVVIFKGHLEGV